jgi:hypothetical protein
MRMYSPLTWQNWKSGGNTDTGQYCRYCDNLAIHAFTIYCSGGKTETGYECQECLDEKMEQARFEYWDKKRE